MSYSEKHPFGRESECVEFKTSFVISAGSHVDDQKFVVFKAVCAMMNTNGGDVYIGVNDIDGSITTGKYYGVNGDKQKKGILTNDEYCRYIHDCVKCYFYDHKYVLGKMQVKETEYDDVVRIHVEKADKVVYIHERNSEERLAFRREGASSREMNRDVINQREYENAQEKKRNAKATKEERIRARIQEAIDRKCKLQIYGYSSSHSDTKTDRVVEPIKFLLEGRSIWAYEEKNEGHDPLRQFRLNRIDNVEVLDEPCKHEKGYKEAYVDAFEWSRATKPTIHITILVGPSAKNQLVEDCPEAQKYLTDCGNNQWVLDADVHSLDPVKRFCQQFLDSINVFVPEELKVELGLVPNPDENKQEAPKSVFKAAMSILKKAFAEIKALKKNAKKSNN